MTDSLTAAAALDLAGDSETRSSGPGWRIVAHQELRDLWLSGRGPTLVFGYSVLLSAITYLAAANRTLNFLEQREAVGLTLQVAVGVGALLVLVTSADAISGERERGTLESLLLAPASRRGIVLGKSIAAMSAWFAAWLISVPYLWILARSVQILGRAVLLGLLVGTVLAAGLAALGILISTISNSNKVSISASVFLLLALFAPTQLPTSATHAGFSDVMLRLNPVASGLSYLSKALVNGHRWTVDLSLLLSPLILAGAAGATLIGLAPRLVRLSAGRSRR